MSQQLISKPDRDYWQSHEELLRSLAKQADLDPEPMLSQKLSSNEIENCFRQKGTSVNAPFDLAEYVSTKRFRPGVLLEFFLKDIDPETNAFVRISTDVMYGIAACFPPIDSNSSIIYEQIHIFALDSVGKLNIEIVDDDNGEFVIDANPLSFTIHKKEIDSSGKNVVLNIALMHAKQIRVGQ